MKNATKSIITLGMIFFLLGAIGGCKGKSEEEQLEEKAKIFVGKYISRKTPDCYLELKEDGTFLRETPVQDFITGKATHVITEGRWEVTGENNIIFTGPLVIPHYGKINNGFLILEYVFGDTETFEKKEGKQRKKIAEEKAVEKESVVSEKKTESHIKSPPSELRARGRQRRERDQSAPNPRTTSAPITSVTPAPSVTETERIIMQMNTKLETYSNKDSFPMPPISLTLRTTAPDLVEKVETIYFTALDYQFFSLRSLRFAKEFLNEGEIAKSKKYIEKADRYYKLATSLQRDSFSVLDSAYSAAQWMVAYKASRTALGFTTTGLGIGASTLFDLGTLYTDYSLDKSTMPLEEAKKNLIATAISNILLQSTGASDLVGDAVKRGWGSSRAFPVLQKVMGSSEFKDAALKEFMRLGGDVGDYAAKKTIEETLERVLRGVNGEKANSTI